MEAAFAFLESSGGLINTVDDAILKKIPLLGSIPNLSALFRSSSTRSERRELLITLTPRILIPGDQFAGAPQGLTPIK